ncbi:MAG: hypothetical protein WAX69_11735 [Victivallales bacterium]
MKSDCLPKEQIIEHLKTGYQNAQEIIRFIDNKTEILLGIVLVVTGGIIAYTINMFEMEKAIYKEIFCLLQTNYCTFILFILILLSGIISIIFLMLCLRARRSTRPSKRFGPPYFILFPCVRQKDSNKAISYYDTTLESMTASDIIKEYKFQLVIVGIILDRKIFFLDWAIKLFILQIALACLASTILFITAKNALNKSHKDKPPISSVQDTASAPSPRVPNNPRMDPTEK